MSREKPYIGIAGLILMFGGIIPAVFGGWFMLPVLIGMALHVIAIFNGDWD